MSKLLLLAALLLSLVSCAAPRTTVVTDDQSGSIRFVVTPNFAKVLVDGHEVGICRNFDGTSAVLKLAAGTHEIHLAAEGYQDFYTKVYISDTQEVVNVTLQAKE